ncbi:DUF1844 domain-containing protein [Desulfococcaceae bacterium HSG8]|nr:DUF1844 domain-containing protein [Desulfococcaceae bacterium HSG8]
MSEEEKKDFTVKDRKKFAEGSDEESNDDSNTSPETETGGSKASGEQEPELRLPEINFSTFIFSLNSSVFVQLGLLEDPATGEESKNLTMAKQTIDILGMLEEKTRGNLTKDEENMLKNILYDLRILYVREKG